MATTVLLSDQTLVDLDAGSVYGTSQVSTVLRAEIKKNQGKQVGHAIYVADLKFPILDPVEQWIIQNWIADTAQDVDPSVSVVGEIGTAPRYLDLLAPAEQSQ